MHAKHQNTSALPTGFEALMETGAALDGVGEQRDVDVKDKQARLHNEKTRRPPFWFSSLHVPCTRTYAKLYTILLQNIFNN